MVLLEFVTTAGDYMAWMNYTNKRPHLWTIAFFFGAVELQLLFPLVRVNCALGVIMVIAVSCVKLLSAHNSTQHTNRKHKV